MSADDHGVADSAVISLAAGAHIAGYRLEERVGQGGMAVVFRAHDERLDRLVALKVLAPTLVGNEEFQRRFISESRVAATIDDPHVVPVFAAGEADGFLFIAMRYVAGGDAQSLLKREGPLPPERAAAIISPVASALDAAHRAGLVHRDVKPSNMLMDVLPGRPAHVYLSDFGLAKSMASTSGLTAAGTILGTLTYMSPQQIGSEPVDSRADQYALACSAFELLAGSPPFQRNEPAALMYDHLFTAPPPLASRRPGLPPAAGAVLAKALAKAPDERYASCGEFADALRGALNLPAYRSGPGAGPARMHPAAGAGSHSPTEAAWPETGADGPAASAATILPPDGPAAPDTARQGGRTADAAAAANTPPVSGAGRLNAGGGRARWRSQRRRIAIAVSVIAAAGLATGLLLGPGRPAAPVAPVPISVKSAFPPVTGDVYVVYAGGKNASAEVSGEVTGASDGEVATLSAQRFPFKSAPAKLSSVTLHPVHGKATYAFRVAPVLATRYRVTLFRSGTSATPVAVSGVRTVYVTTGESPSKTQTCGGSVCYESAVVTFTAPPTALKAEMAKTPYPYFGINRSKTGKPVPPPPLMSLGAGHATASGTQQYAADRFNVTMTFSFPAGDHPFNAAYGVCLKDAVTTDGIGLPGHHRCGDQRVSYPTGYLG